MSLPAEHVRDMLPGLNTVQKGYDDVSFINNFYQKNIALTN